MVLFSVSCTILWTSVHSSSGNVLTSYLVPWIYLLPLLRIHTEFYLSPTWLVQCFSRFSLFKPEFCYEKLVIWAALSSRSCFCWPYISGQLDNNNTWNPDIALVLRNWSFPCCSVAKSCPTACNPMNCSTPDFPVPHYLPEFVQIHGHWVSDAI